MYAQPVNYLFLQNCSEKRRTKEKTHSLEWFRHCLHSTDWPQGHFLQGREFLFTLNPLILLFLFFVFYHFKSIYNPLTAGWRYSIYLEIYGKNIWKKRKNHLFWIRKLCVVLSGHITMYRCDLMCAARLGGGHFETFGGKRSRLFTRRKMVLKQRSPVVLLVSYGFVWIDQSIRQLAGNIAVTLLHCFIYLFDLRKAGFGTRVHFHLLS